MTNSPVREFPHLRILASAGSGKTYNLTTRYMQLFIKGRPANSILASTFTRAAAGHIRDDVLRTLALAAIDPLERKKFNERIKGKELSEQDIFKLLRKLTKSLHRLQIRTLDSFFGSVVRSFSLELGVPLASDIVDEHKIAKLRAEAIRLMLDERKPQDLVDLLRSITQGNSDRSVMNSIDNIVRQLYEIYCQTDSNAWECVPRLKGKLSSMELLEAISNLASYDLRDIKRSSKARDNDVAKANNQDWFGFIKAGLAAKIISGDNKYYSHEFEKELIDAYKPVIDHAKAILVGRLRNLTIATRNLLKLFDEYFSNLKQQHRAMTFSDVTYSMRDAESLGRMQDICFRLDANLHNLLLDEFQDTSIEQWRALQPIVLEIISYNDDSKTFFCVGDIKQSIYGWRNAAPEVLDDLHNLLKAPDGRTAIEDKTLEKSFRSSQVVIDVVNQVFDSLISNEAIADEPNAAAKWSKGFKHHTTDKKDLPGYAQLRFAPRAEKGENKHALRLRHAADIIAAIHKRNPQLSIGVLTRSNKSIGQLRFELGPSNRNIPTGGRGGGTLTDSPAINAILDVIRLADHPDDTIAAFNIANSPLRDIIKLQNHNAAKQRHTIAANLRKRLLENGYAPTIGKWMGQIASSCDARELERMELLIELARQFDERSSLRPIDFVDLVQMLAVKEVRPAPVEVMTIHQSKGLEFDVVVLADLETKLAGDGKQEIVFERDGATGPIARICRYINKETLALVPDLQPLFTGERLRTVCESLSLLYVAITRARHALHIIIDPPKENEKTFPKTLAGILRNALVEDDTAPGEIAYTRGNEDWLDDHKLVAKENLEKPSIQKQKEIKLAKPIDAPWRSTIASPSTLAQGNIISALSLPNEDALANGNVIHALFEQVKWIEDWQETDESLMAIAAKAAPRRKEQWLKQRVTTFKEMLTKQEVRKALSHKNRDPRTIGVLREQPFVRLVDGAVQRGIIDRLEFERDGSNVISATVIDFKTDDVSADETKKAAEDYRLQLEAYRDAAAEILKIDAKKLRMKVLYVTPGVAVEI